MSSDSKVLALFDFDGTITTKDSFRHFLIFSHGQPRFAINLLLLAPTVVLFFLSLISAQRAKELVIRRFYRGFPAAQFDELARQFVAKKIPDLLRPAATARLHWHQRQGHRIIIVSASPQQVLQPFADSLGIELLATGLATNRGALTGALSTPNCQGAEKVKRIRAHLDLADYSSIYAYGNSRGDRAMLALAQHAFYRSFPTQIEAH